MGGGGGGGVRLDIWTAGKGPGHWTRGVDRVLKARTGGHCGQDKGYNVLDSARGVWEFVPERRHGLGYYI